MAVRNDGIQALLAAEKAAGELVAEAKRRTLRMILIFILNAPYAL